MAGYRNERVVSLFPLLIIASILFAIAQPRIAFATNPDIPRIQAEAEKGSIQEQIELAAAYLAGRGVPQDEKQAAYWYEKAANSGDPAAQQEIGYFYQTGIGVERDPVRAFQWFQRAVAGGLISAKVNLGSAFVWGLGVGKDPVVGARLFREAAEKGNGSGACYLGLMYYMGQGIPKDESQGVHWLKVGAKLHNASAQLDLALILLKQPGETNHERALKLLRESATAGQVAAMHQLGLEIINRPSLARKPNEGISLVQEAASDGFWRSFLVLGALLRDGRELAQDHKAAYYHFRLATLLGGEKAATLTANDLRALSLELGQAQIQEIDQNADAWVQKHNRPLEFVNRHVDKASGFPQYALQYPTNDVHAGMLVNSPEAYGSFGTWEVGGISPQAGSRIMRQK